MSKTNHIIGVEVGIAISIIFGMWMLALVVVLGRFLDQYSERISGRTSVPKLKNMDKVKYQDFLLAKKIYVGLPAWAYPKGTWFMPVGAYEDYLRLVANEHAMLSMILADKEHPYTRRERQVTYFVTQCFGFFFCTLTASLRNQMQGTLINIFVVSPFMIILNYFFYYLLAQPCCTNCWACCNKCCGFLGHSIAFLFVIVGFIMIWMGALILTTSGNFTLEEGKGIMWQYFTQVALVSAVQDMVLRAVPYWEGQSCCCRVCIGWLYVFDKLTCGMLYVGGWRKEQLKVAAEEGSGKADVEGAGGVSADSKYKADAVVTEQPQTIVASGNVYAAIPQQAPPVVQVTAMQPVTAGPTMVYTQTAPPGGMVLQQQPVLLAPQPQFGQPAFIQQPAFAPQQPMMMMGGGGAPIIMQQQLGGMAPAGYVQMMQQPAPAGMILQPQQQGMPMVQQGVVVGMTMQQPRY